jgi:hypothetical protein
MSAPVIDFEAVCNALAARFVAAAIGTPSGQTAMKKSYPEPPESAPQTPCHILEVQDGSVVANPGQWKHEMQVDGVFLISRRTGDTIRPEAIRRKWLPYLLHATVDQMKLGLGSASGYTVDKAWPTGWEWDEYKVAATEYHAIRVHWTVYITENVALTP